MKTYSMISDQELNSKLTKSHEAYKKWSRTPLKERLSYISSLSQHLLQHEEHYAKLISMEMGKPISQSRAEIEKSTLLCDYYVENADQLLQDVIYASNARKSVIHYESIGGIYGVMPWNFPFWQVFRFFCSKHCSG
jgi:succinate-semialdehyde dehydrogenase / glutarate-semialdehyde dehydrogenase